MRRYKHLPSQAAAEKVDPIPLTADFFAQIKEKHQQLSAEIIEVKKRLKTAREMGDLSENGAYRYAKFELGSIGRQLSQLSFLLKHGFTPQTKKSDQIGFASVVHLQNQSTQQKYIYTLVSQYEADPKQGKISLQSPLGQQLIGKVIGDTVSLKTAQETVVYRVLEVE